MSWVSLDPQELGATGAHLRDASAALLDSAARVRAACCIPGLGRHSAPLMGEGEALAVRTIRMTEDYLRLGIDILQRAIVAIRDGQLVSAVGGVGTVSAAVIGGTYVGGHSWSDGITVGGGSSMTIGGTSWSDGITVGGGSSMTIGGTSWSDGITVGGGSSMTIGGTSWSDGLTIGGGGTSIVGGAGSFVGGGSGMAGGVMALAGAAQKSQERQQAILAALRASGGGTTTSGGLGNQMLTGMLTAQALQRIEDSQTRTAASSPIAGYPQAQAADATDFGGRARAMDDERYRERQRQGLT